MTTAVEAPDACTAWLHSFYGLPLAERKWVIDFITHDPDEAGADVAARLRELYALPDEPLEPLTVEAQRLADEFGAGGATLNA